MKYFTLKELSASATATRYGIDNTPPPVAKQNIERLVAEVLDPVREEWGVPIRVGSGYRCKVVNRKVAGAKNSAHLYGLAADITAITDTKEDNRRLFDLIVKMQNERKIVCDQIIDEYDYNWIHVAIADTERNCEYSYKSPRKKVLHLGISI